MENISSETSTGLTFNYQANLNELICIFQNKVKVYESYY